MTFSADGSPTAFDESDPDTWVAADPAQPEIVQLGAVRFKIVGDGEELALASAWSMPTRCLPPAYTSLLGRPTVCRCRRSVDSS